MTAVDQLAVVVPAADEEELLPACLAALRRARDELAGTPELAGVAVRVIVVLDACTDRSAEIVAAAPDVEALCVAHRNVGRARAAGCRQALAGAADPGAVWLATTDADSTVPAGWLRSMLDHARAGADLVLGTVVPDEAGAADPRLAAEWARSYTARDGHRHVHGANLGVRGDAYVAVHGWSPLAFDEDVDLVQRLEALSGRRVVRTAAVPVRTSTRRGGRSPRGFAGWVRALDDLDPAG